MRVHDRTVASFSYPDKPPRYQSTILRVATQATSCDSVAKCETPSHASSQRKRGYLAHTRIGLVMDDTLRRRLRNGESLRLVWPKRDIKTSAPGSPSRGVGHLQGVRDIVFYTQVLLVALGLAASIFVFFFWSSS